MGRQIHVRRKLERRRRLPKQKVRMPPPKDRLAAMQQNAYIEEGDDFEVGMGDEEGPLKEFFKEVEDIRNNCEKVNTKIEEVKKLQRQEAALNKRLERQGEELEAGKKELRETELGVGRWEQKF